MIEAVFSILRVAGAIISTKMSGSPVTQLKWIFALIITFFLLALWVGGGPGQT